MRSKAPGDLEQEVADLRSETLALRKANNELAQAARLQKVRQQKLVDELKHATRLPEHRTAASRTRERELDEFVAALRDENAKLRRRNLKLHDSVRLAADRPVKSKRQTPRPRKENRVANRVRDMLDQIGERVARAESKVDDVAPRPPVERHNRDILDLQERLKDSHTKVQILEHQIGQIEAAMQAGKQVQRHAVEQVDKYKALLEDMQGKYRAAQAKVKQLEVTSEQTAALNLMIEDLQATNANLQAQVDGLTRSAFMSDEADSRRLRSVEADHLAQISELRLVVAERDHALESSTAKINDQMARLQQLEAEALQSAQEREQLQRELATIRERMRHLDDRVHVFTADSGVELEELDLALDLIRRQKGLFRAAGPDADPVTIPALQRKVRELEILNKDLVTELKCKEDMLRIQTHLNSELDAEYTRVQAENRDLKQSIFEMQRSVAARPRAESVISDMSLLSQLSTLSFTENHNVIVVRVTGARFTSLKDGTDALTFIGIDFFDFETVYSGVFAGAQPHYKLTAQFKVAVDAFLLDHLRSKSIRVDVYRQTDQGDVQRFAVCCIPLAGLLGHTQRIRDSYEAVDVDKTGKPVGTIDVVAKMYRPVVSTLPTPADSDNGTPREDGKSATFTMRMTLGVQSLVVNGVDHADGLTLHAHNMYYNVDGVAERVTGKDRPTFAIEFETKHDRLLPHELVRFEVLKGGPDGTLVGHFDLVLTRIAQAQYGEITSTLPVKDDNDGEIGACDLSVEWILAANPLT